MMTDSITVLREKLCGINNHFEVLKRIESIIHQQEENDDVRYVQLYQTEEKIFNYRANIISLYGVFECFIEEAFKEYVKRLRDIIPHYDSLNDKIKKSYFTNVAKLHGKLGYAKFSHISESQIAQNIERVIVQNKNEILAESYLGNGGNYKHDTICSLMNSIGILGVDKNIIQISPLSELLFEETFDKGQQQQMVRMRIEDLVNRRNEVAHGVTTDDIAGADYFDDMSNFIMSYCESLNELLNNDLLAHKWKQLSSIIYSPIKLYGTSIVELKVNNVNLKIGNKILIQELQYPLYVEAEIIGIRIKDNITGTIYEKESVCINDEEHSVTIKFSTIPGRCEKLKFV